ncbi:60S ribosomal protein L18 [Trichuris trichiura]|uniref:Large ribosomal subunit protein eL18 n=1 Tax=Trichuris trichiura TaxID=36087 RepID=A0A077ZKD7_TRITR|nr:60S ribosomal protein L18 [Trichuris trichiura]
MRFSIGITENGAGIDISHRFDRKSVRRHAKSKDPYVQLLCKLYRFLVRRTGAKFNKIILKRLYMARRHRPPMSLRRVAKHMGRKGRKEKICVLVGTVTNDMRLYDVPPMKICALHVTERARARILKAGGEIMTFDELALRAPKGENTQLLQAARSTRKQEKHFGNAPGTKNSHAK